MLTRTPKTPKSRKSPPRGTWKLQDAKTHFSEVVRRARAEGPQRVTVHGKDAVVVVGVEEFAKTSPTAPDTRTGADLIKAMQKARKLGLKLKPARIYARVRPPIDFSDIEQ
jgi:prevent-host-death family protein